MKTRTILFMMMLLGVFALQVEAQDKKKDKEKVTFEVSLSCNNCKNKIEKNVAYEKGVTDLEVDLKAKTVTIEFKTKQTNRETLKKAIEKLGFEVKYPEEKKKEKA